MLPRPTDEKASFDIVTDYTGNCEWRFANRPRCRERRDNIYIYIYMMTRWKDSPACSSWALKNPVTRDRLSITPLMRGKSYRGRLVNVRLETNLLMSGSSLIIDSLMNRVCGVSIYKYHVWETIHENHSNHGGVNKIKRPTSKHEDLYEIFIFIFIFVFHKNC